MFFLKMKQKFKFKLCANVNKIIDEKGIDCVIFKSQDKRVKEIWFIQQIQGAKETRRKVERDVSRKCKNIIIDSESQQIWSDKNYSKK